MGLREFAEKFRKLPKDTAARMEREYASELGGAFAEQSGQRSLLLYALQLYNEDRFPAALDTLAGLLKKCRTDEDRRAVLLFTALCRSDSCDRDGAVAAYQELLRYAPGYSTALSNLGQLLMAQKEYEEAEEYLVAAEKSDPKNAYAKHNLGALCYRMGQYEKAIPLCEAALLQNRNLYQACTTLALCFMALGDRTKSKHYENLAIIRGQNAAALKRALRDVSARQYDGPALSEEMEQLLQRWHERTARKSNLLYVTGAPLGRSRIGGPSLGEAPLDESGKPMRLLGAIYCEEFAPSPILPDKGLLRIYIAEDGSFGLNLENPTAQTGFRVLYDSEFDHLTPGEDPGSWEEFPVGGCYGIRPGAAGMQPMPPSDFRFDGEFSKMVEELGLEMPDEDAMEAICEWLNPEGHRMGGYPWFTQEDPRWEAEYQKYDTLLFQLDSMDFPQMHIDIGDSGVMNFFIPEENLKRLDFSDVLYWWDCY